LSKRQGKKRCPRKEKQEFKIGQNPSLCKRRKETRSGRRGNLIELKDNANANAQVRARVAVEKHALIPE